MVAFKIRYNATYLDSYVIGNDGIDDSAKDFRFEDEPYVTMLEKAFGSISILKRIPIIKFIGRKITNLLVSRKFTAKKYFNWILS